MAPAGRTTQFKIRQPCTTRRPCSRVRAKSRPCLIRRARGNPSATGGEASMTATRVQTGVSRLRPTRRRFRKIPRPLLLELRLRKPCCRLRRIFEGWYCRFMSVPGSSGPRPPTVRPTEHCGSFLRHGRRESSSERRGVKRLANSLGFAGFCRLTPSYREPIVPPLTRRHCGQWLSAETYPSPRGSELS